MTAVKKKHEFRITDRHLEYNLDENNNPIASLVVDAEIDGHNVDKLALFMRAAGKWNINSEGKAPTLNVDLRLPDFMLSLIEQNKIGNLVHIEAKPKIDAMKHELQCMLKHLNEVEFTKEEQ